MYMCVRMGAMWIYIYKLGGKMSMEKEAEDKVRKGKRMISLCEMEGDRRKSTGQEIM